MPDGWMQTAYTYEVESRLEKFRALIARLNPAADPLAAIRDGLVVPHALRTTGDEIAARLELDPTSSHLLVGGIGSGKTTQLLLAGERLRAVDDTVVNYIDVSAYHDLSHLKPGTLIVAAGLALSRKRGPLNDDVRQAKLAFAQWAYGYVRWVDVPPEFDHEDPDEDRRGQYAERVPPLLSLPQVRIDGSLAEKVGTLLTLARHGTSSKEHVVLLLDALDRVSNIDAFASIVEQDVRALSNAGVGVVIAGPLRSMFGSNRAMVDRFQYFYVQSPVDVQRNSSARQFVCQILQKRDPGALLTEPVCEKIADCSGGVLRDAITLARGAGEHAYISGAEEVVLADVDFAADAFGRQLLFGLTSRELSLLQRARKTGTFVPTTDAELSLLMTRRVLEYAGAANRFAVHPTLAPLLESIDTQEGEA